MAKKKKKIPIHHKVRQHAKRVLVITPKFVHGMFIGAVVGALLVLVLREVNPASAATAVARDCTTNSIMKCGATTKTEFINKVKANSPGDLKAVYNYFGLPSNLYNNFVKYAATGNDMRDGRIIVNGKTIATNAYSVGRTKFGGKTSFKINGKTYWKGPNSQSFGAGINSIPVWVFYKSNGDIQFVVMKACGNPVGGHSLWKPKPTPPPSPPPHSPSPPPPSPTPPPPTPTPPPPTPPPPTPQPVTPTAAALPNTGPGAVLIIALLAIIGGYVFHMSHRHIKRKRHHTVHHHKPAHAHHRK